MIKFWTPRGMYGFLSNFYAARVIIDDKEYNTNEHFFQSKKFEGTRWEAHIRNLATPAETAKEGKRRDLPLRKDWENVKEEIMYNGLKAKFAQHPKLLEKLLATGEQELVEDSPYDSYWGVGRDGKGKNRLGHLLMQLRSEFRTAIGG